MIRCVLLRNASRAESVLTYAGGIDRRFCNSSARWFAIEGGQNHMPPGSAFTASLEAMPLLFFDLLVLDPEISPDQLSAMLGGLQQHAAPLAQLILTPTQQGAVRDATIPVEGAPQSEGSMAVTFADRPSCWGLEAWCEARAGQLAFVLAYEKRRGDTASYARCDDLALELLDAHADRLFGQPRRRALSLGRIGGPRPDLWRPLVEWSPSGNTGRAAMIGCLPSAADDGIEKIRAEVEAGTAAALSLAASLEEAMSGPLASALPGTATLALEARDFGLTAAALINRLGDRLGPVLQTHRSVSALAASIATYRELRWLMKGRAFFHWLSAEQEPPAAAITVFAASTNAAASTAAERFAQFDAGAIVVARGAVAKALRPMPGFHPVLEQGTVTVAVKRVGRDVA